VASQEAPAARRQEELPFGGVFAESNAKERGYREFVSGRLIDSGKARGVLRVSGSDVPLRGGGHGECDSGLRLRRVSR
jgi:hypothetical protein